MKQRPSRQLCPECGKEYMADDEHLWIYRSRFYCSESCCRTAAWRLGP